MIKSYCTRHADIYNANEWEKCNVEPKKEKINIDCLITIYIFLTISFIVWLNNSVVIIIILELMAKCMIIFTIFPTKMIWNWPYKTNIFESVNKIFGELFSRRLLFLLFMFRFLEIIHPGIMILIINTGINISTIHTIKSIFVLQRFKAVGAYYCFLLKYLNGPRAPESIPLVAPLNWIM